MRPVRSEALPRPRRSIGPRAGRSAYRTSVQAGASQRSARTALSAAPRRMSCSETSTLVEAERAQGLAQHRHAGDDRGRAVGVQARDLAALVVRHRRERGRAARSSVARVTRVAVDPVGVVGLELEVHRRGRRRRAGDGDRGVDALRLSAGTPSVDRAASTSSTSASSSSCVRRVGVEVALGLADDAGLQRDVEVDVAAAADDDLGRAAADVDDDDRAVVARRAGARSSRRGRSARPPRRRGSCARRGRSAR